MSSRRSFDHCLKLQGVKLLQLDSLLKFLAEPVMDILHMNTHGLPGSNAVSLSYSLINLIVMFC